jgi:hypothetical protein
MTADALFSYGNMIAMAGWVLLALAPLWKPAERIANGVIVTLFALTYALLAILFFQADDLAKFGSLQGVKGLFQNDFALLTGWVHYLAFDLFVGCWMYRNARRHRIPHLLFILCGAFTFMLGPCGLLLYLIIRLVRTKRFLESPTHD